MRRAWIPSVRLCGVGVLHSITCILGKIAKQMALLWAVSDTPQLLGGVQPQCCAAVVLSDGNRLAG